MITEDYVSSEIAKLLKEKGFCENTEHEIWYVIKQFSTGCHWNSCTYKIGDITREYNDDCCILMPTLQMARKWLREIHDIDIMIWVENYNGIKQYVSDCWKNVTQINSNFHRCGRFSSYNEAYEVTIKYCLENLI